ncbi:hypothetical protein BDB00DRAFT_796930 [Zychaea mexicana]|uniref:uncharacterized protein n=1 Tax=Zychaea mexicana TaxID=64656 RepID=UPI0022FF4274|nr:uncharacterized protein BDB00DRAFT_796930 [Zychaea mexicana]KAI9498850.1 hypothetical protein BDB00DRAFT_796930 [Zychaea mexicana]
MKSSAEAILRQAPEAINPREFIRELLDAIKLDKDFYGGKKLYSHYLKGVLKTKDPSNQYPDLHDPNKPAYQRARHLSDEEIRIFQKATSSLVRYAPNPDVALRFAEFFLVQVAPPLRNEQTELIILVSIMYCYTHARHNKCEYLRKGLDWVRIGLERGLALRRTKVPLRSGFERTSQMFASTAEPILSYHRLTPSADGREMIKQNELFILRCNT